MRVLGEFHGAIGRLVKRFDATFAVGSAAPEPSRR